MAIPVHMSKAAIFGYRDVFFLSLIASFMVIPLIVPIRGPMPGGGPKIRAS